MGITFINLGGYHTQDFEKKTASHLKVEWHVEKTKHCEAHYQGVLIKCVRIVINFMKQNNMYYGSDIYLNQEIPQKFLFDLVDNVFCIRTKYRLNDLAPYLKPNDIGAIHVSQRKAGSGKLKEDDVLLGDDTDSGVFGSSKKDINSRCTVYVSLARLKATGPIYVKIGHTRKNIDTYMETTGRILLGVFPGGDEVDNMVERELLRKWKKHLAEKNEWFHPVDEIFNWVKTTLVCVPNIKQIVEKHIGPVNWTEEEGLKVTIKKKHTGFK